MTSVGLWLVPGFSLVPLFSFISLLSFGHMDLLLRAWLNHSNVVRSNPLVVTNPEVLVFLLLACPQRVCSVRACEVFPLFSSYCR